MPLVVRSVREVCVMRAVVTDRTEGESECSTESNHLAKPN